MAGLLQAMAEEESRVLLLSSALVGVTLIALIAVGTVAGLLLRKTPVYFIPPTGPGFVHAGDLDNGYVESEASRFVLEKHMWTTKTLPHAQNLFKARLHPRLIKTYEKETMPAEAKLAKDHKLGSQFAVTHTETVDRVGNQRRVFVHGIRSLWFGGIMREEEVTVTLVLMPIIINGLPQGLQVFDYKETPPLQVVAR
jgi:hypothetical protein